MKHSANALKKYERENKERIYERMEAPSNADHYLCACLVDGGISTVL